MLGAIGVRLVALSRGFGSRRPRTASSCRCSAGNEGAVTRADDVMLERPSAPRALGRIVAGTFVSVSVGRWRSGLYFVRLTAPERVGYAPSSSRPDGWASNPSRSSCPLVRGRPTTSATTTATARATPGMHGRQPGGEARAAILEPWRAAALQPLRPSLPPLAPCHRPSRRRLAQADLDEVGGRALAAATGCSSSRATTSM